MKKNESKKLVELIGENFEPNEMQQILGGNNDMLRDGCVTGVCSRTIEVIYCQGGAVCTSGIA